MYISSQNNYIDAVRLLAKAKADVNHANDKGVTPLSIAVYNGHAECVQCLLEQGADYTRTDKKHARNALGWAIYCERTKCIEVLKAYIAAQT